MQTFNVPEGGKKRVISDKVTAPLHTATHSLLRMQPVKDDDAHGWLDSTNPVFTSGTLLLIFTAVQPIN